MADATAPQLRNRVLEKLFVLRAGETANSQEDETIGRISASVHEKLRDMELCYWPETAVPQAVLEDLAAYIACYAAGDFMDAVQAMQFRQMNEDRALAELRRLTATRERTDLPTRALYF